MEKADIKKLKGQLKKGDQKTIHELSGLSNVTVSKFFKGREDRITEENVTKILKATATVIRNREKVLKKNDDLINSL